ncbi:hypothetical protein HNY73_008580 [Argiope bruennichi]|uniref:Uncharacterized protein n=1 Tax=Argiope bruennichi TaxID=94029 RepID=A0A8T0F7V7_ARGBR|nr:hypothetical protein HNY73_008580 [Argiope bruennichi]
MAIKWTMLSCILSFSFFIFATRIFCGTVCEEAKQWLKDNGDGLKNVSDLWIQLKPWVSGNNANCLKSLLNDTKDDESMLKLYDVLRRDVFKAITNSTKPGKKKKACPSRRPRGNRNCNRNHKPGVNAQNTTRKSVP